MTTKTEMMSEVENREEALEKLRAERANIDGQIKAHENEIERVWTELYALGVTRARPRKAKGEQTPAKKRGAKPADKEV